jgi:hypothetical protein
VVQRNLRRAAAAVGVTALAGFGLVTSGATAFAGTSTATSYDCTLTGIIPETETEALTVTTPDSAASGSTVQVTFTQPGTSTTVPVAITDTTISGTASVSGDDPTTTLPFTGDTGPLPSGSTQPDITATAALTLPAADGTVTVTLPTTYTLSVDLGILGTEAGTCTATAPTSASITVTG